MDDVADEDDTCELCKRMPMVGAICVVRLGPHGSSRLERGPMACELCLTASLALLGLLRREGIEAAIEKMKLAGH